MTIPLFKVAMDEQAIRLAAETLASGYVGQGPRVEAFEAAFGRLVEADVPPLSTSSGTAALTLALQLLGIGPGDEVVTTPMTCAATNAPIVMSGATLRWADVDPITGLIDPDDARRQITARTKAIMAVDWGGRACDYGSLRIAGVPVIEDAAHALLTRRDGESIATSGGDYVCWSFQAIKALTTVDGGALLPPAWQVERARKLRWYGLDRRSAASFRSEQEIMEVGTKWHMNDVAAAVGLGNLPGVGTRVARAKENAAAYWDALDGLLGLTVPWPSTDASWWLYTLLVPRDRQPFIEGLRRHGVESGLVHSRNDHHPGFAARAIERHLPGVDEFAARQVSIPVGWWVGEKERAVVIDAVTEALVGQRQSALRA